MGGDESVPGEPSTDAAMELADNVGNERTTDLPPRAPKIAVKSSDTTNGIHLRVSKGKIDP